ncbi:MAG: glutaminyl-peptide cyclotransferase [Candidatus Promineifilaceae bacterium]
MRKIVLLLWFCLVGCNAAAPTLTPVTPVLTAATLPTSLPTQTPAPSMTPTPTPIPSPTAPPVGTVLQMEPELLTTRPHDPTAFTQGLILYNGSLYESTGLYGQSSLREVDPATGTVIRQIPLTELYFAEGLERVEDRLIQITWQEQIAFVYDIATFTQIKTFTYEGEGWGLCYDGTALYMSNGSDQLTVRDPDTFVVRQTIPVTLDGQPVVRLNELECVGSTIFANIWQTDTIVQIDKVTGQVVASIQADGLLTPEEAAAADVLNGIVYLPATDTFLITGKLWPAMFEVRFVLTE